MSQPEINIDQTFVDDVLAGRIKSMPVPDDMSAYKIYEQTTKTLLDQDKAIRVAGFDSNSFHPYTDANKEQRKAWLARCDNLLRFLMASFTREQCIATFSGIVMDLKMPIDTRYMRAFDQFANQHRSYIMGEDGDLWKFNVDGDKVTLEPRGLSPRRKTTQVNDKSREAFDSMNASVEKILSGQPHPKPLDQITAYNIVANLTFQLNYELKEKRPDWVQRADNGIAYVLNTGFATCIMNFVRWAYLSLDLPLDLTTEAGKRLDKWMMLNVEPWDASLTLAVARSRLKRSS